MGTDEPVTLYCPLCCTPYPPNDTISEERFEAGHDPKSQTNIFTAKKKKKLR